ncbi:MAG TPA: alanine racemase [Xanthobacteraceae bacterium]|nr:alanine racemase [Xanthobacteraceae bacterium]
MPPRTSPAPVPSEPIAAGPSEAEAGGLLTIDLAALQENWRRLGQQALPVECAAVVKADGYGCGIEQVGAALLKAGCKTFFVADLSEARRLRPAVQDAAIYVLDGALPGSGPAFAEVDARPVIGSLVELAEWDRFIAGSNWRGRAAIHVDTGMNRLGMSVDEVIALAPRLQRENHGFTLLMSHLACAETPEHPLNEKQIRLFREIRVQFRGLTASLANSSGIFLGDGALCDMVRPGVALYGVNPTPGKPNPMLPVVGLQARIIQVRLVAKGETVGYGGVWTAKRAARIAVIAAGYADGYPRAASSANDTPGGEAIVAGKRCPIAGRISMDLMAIDVTDLAEGDARRGEYATLIGGDISVDDVARFGGTIGYEVLTRLGRRYHRVYRGA